MDIGGVVFENDLVWDGEFSSPSVAGTSERAIDGHLVVQSQALLGGQPLTLVGGVDSGWLARSTVIALKALAAVPGAVYTVTLADSRTFQASFDPAAPPEFSPVSPRSAPASDSWYYGTIKMFIL